LFVAKEVKKRGNGLAGAAAVLAPTLKSSLWTQVAQDSTMHVHQQWLSLNDCQVPSDSMFPSKVIMKRCKQHGHSPRCLTMALNHRLRKNNAFLSPAFKCKVTLHNLLETFHVRGRQRLS
jgi:hypothetical protein